MLFPPAAMALVSNNAVPGDITYSVKRTLEDGIFAIASLHPVSRAWFAAARSDRRFEEVTVLLGRGKSATATLNELVIQTDITIGEIVKIEDTTKKAELINQLVESIEKYDEGLSEFSLESIMPVPTPTPSSTLTPSSNQKPIVTSEATPTVSATPRPTPQSTPNNTSLSIDSTNRDEVNKTRNKLEETKKKVREQQQKVTEQKVTGAEKSSTTSGNQSQ